MTTGNPGVYRRTAGALTPDEELYTLKDGRYRPWDPRKSKLAAYILNGGIPIPFSSTTNVLYLGAASGTTASHVADICSNGLVYCVEFSKRPFRDLIRTCERYENMVPILSDARRPARYSPLVGDIDVVYMDIAQRDQPDIFLSNLKVFLSDPNGDGSTDEINGILMLKSRSVDMARSPRKVYEEVLERLGGVLKVVDTKELTPYEKDHLAILVTYRAP